MPLAHFAADKFPETDKGIDDLIATGTPTAPAILDAPEQRSPFLRPAGSRKGLLPRCVRPRLDDAATGAKADGVMEGGLKKVRLNNGIRSKIGAAVGALDLLSPDRTKRLAAAETAFRAHDVKAEGSVETAPRQGKRSRPSRARSSRRMPRSLAVSGSGSEPDSACRHNDPQGEGRRRRDGPSSTRWPRHRTPRRP